MEWLFLTCHNYWIVCHLVRDDGGHPYFAYSPSCRVENSELFQTFLGIILSVLNDVPVHNTASNPNVELDII
jgi:hypothetical protein